MREIAELLALSGGNPFRIRAYRNAARTIGDPGIAVPELLRQGKKRTDFPGIGDDRPAKVGEIARICS